MGGIHRRQKDNGGPGKVISKTFEKHLWSEMWRTRQSRAVSSGDVPLDPRRWSTRKARRSPEYPGLHTLSPAAAAGSVVE
jgi:hypothetical protein